MTLLGRDLECRPMICEGAKELRNSKLVDYFLIYRVTGALNWQMSKSKIM